MKALILNFRSFPRVRRKITRTSSISLSICTISKARSFTTSSRTLRRFPFRMVSSEKNVNNFPMMADLETRISQSAGQNGRPQFRFYVDKIKAGSPRTSASSYKVVK